MTSEEVAQRYAEAMLQAVTAAIQSGGLSFPAMTQIVSGVQFELLSAAQATSTLQQAAPSIQQLSDIARKIAVESQKHEDARIDGLLRLGQP